MISLRQYYLFDVYNGIFLSVQITNMAVVGYLLTSVSYDMVY